LGSFLLLIALNLSQKRYTCCMKRDYTEGQTLRRALRAHAAGDLDSALAELERLCREAPSYLAGVRALATLALDAGRLTTCIEAAEHVLASVPADAAALAARARASARLHRSDAPNTRLALERMAEFDSAAAHGRALLALDQKRSSECIAWLDRAVQLDPDNLVARALRASCYVRLRKLEEARRDFDLVLEAEPGQVRARMGRARLCSMQGDFEVAESDYRTVLEHLPGYTPALAGLLSIRPNDLDELIITAEKLLEESRCTADHWVELAYATAKALAYTGRYEGAFRAAHLANQRQAARIANHGQAVICKARKKDGKASKDGLIGISDADLERELLLDSQYAALGPGAKSANGNDDRPIPVIVCGLPRSGTSLVEQILASHSNVYGGGENPYLRNVAAWLAASRQPEKCLQKNRTELADGYIKSLTAQCTDARFIVDKMPENWRHLGLLYALLGKVPVIRVYRDPRDVAISIYLEHFSETEAFASTFNGIVATVRQERKAFSFWASDGRVTPYTLGYEFLVSNPQSEIPAVLNHLGLAFEPACMTPQASSGVVATPSRWQVRQVINTKSVGRWRQYSRFAPEFFAMLEPYILTEMKIVGDQQTENQDR